MIYSNELQVEIDDVYGCPGKCPGCVLSALERKSYNSDMDIAIRKRIILLLNDYIKNLSYLEKVNITYGIADHLIMDNDYLFDIYYDAAKLIVDNHLDTGYNSVFISTSLIGKHEKIVNKLKDLHNRYINTGFNVPLLLIAVLDPIKLYNTKNFSEIYKDNIYEANKLFKRVDLAINLSDDAISNITPQQLYDFALLNHFDEVTINYAPTKDNFKYTNIDLEKLSNWLISFNEILEKQENISTSYTPILKKILLNRKNDENLISTLSTQIDEVVKKSIQFDHLGNVFPKFEAVGDVPHNNRFGYSELGNVMEIENLTEFMNEKIPTIKKNILSSLKNKVCMKCDYIDVCAVSGYHVYNNVFKHDSECSHIGYKMINYFNGKMK